MRRWLGVLLILSYWLEPLAAAFPAGSESRLPACCRRHGAHHCAMSAEMAANPAQAPTGSAPVLTAPARCPYFPSQMAASTTPASAMVASATGLPILLAAAHLPAADRAAALLNQVRTRTGRAPPSSLLG